MHVTAGQRCLREGDDGEEDDGEEDDGEEDDGEEDDGKENDGGERGDGNHNEVGCSRACMEEPPPDPLGGDHSAGPWQRTRAVGKGGPAHSDDIFKGALQLRLRTESSWLLHTVIRRLGGNILSNL